ncbi:hypothetical protein HBI56_002900 [Parastagonospora nodorum]|nr:hypothetical protein HBH52_151940 [Parastagonospora nodorum]KAH3983402.1 hypothetical protein HBH51_034830 [Parastagonospora nodorum]KAH4032886.1 hypothetical protein HBI13_003300 [Parastagonospora nodorum]KAH4041694.1 hypothetical protein HBI09_003240 [Parastagonospora nodorum]KAH4099150.1 hypothetical protein HBH48_003310 [Parastagonospora nodorum]
MGHGPNRARFGRILKRPLPSGLWNHGIFPIGEPVLTSCMPTLAQAHQDLILFAESRIVISQHSALPFSALHLSVSRSIPPSPYEHPKNVAHSHNSLAMQPSNILLALLGASTTLAAPMDHRLEDIQCRCLSFSTDAKPTPCTYMESQRMDWHTANSLAEDYELEIQFASQHTISNILSIRRPLPDSILDAISEAEVMPVQEEDLMQRRNKIVCGFDEEVKHLGSHRGMEPECHFVSYVVAALMALVAVYLLAEYVWSRFFSQGAIKLDGSEKTLMAKYETTQEESSRDAPSTLLS